jgi:signal transduction histidine kinase
VRQTLPKSGSTIDMALGGELKQVLSETGRLWGCTTSLSMDPQDARVPAAMVSQLSLMITEAVSNAVRHGQASRVDVTIQKKDERLLIKVRDNGCTAARGVGVPLALAAYRG